MPPRTKRPRIDEPSTSRVPPPSSTVPPPSSSRAISSRVPPSSSSMPPPSSSRVPPSSSRAPPQLPASPPSRQRRSAPASPPSRQRRSAPASPTRHLNPVYISPLAQTNYQNYYRTKTINSGRKVVFDDFGDYRIGPIFDKLGLVDFCSISHPYYPKLIKLFFANLRVDDNGLTSRVNGKDVAISYKDFADFIGLPDEGLIIHHYTPLSFPDFPDGHSIESMDLALNHISSSVLNNVSNYNIQCQIIAKIVLTNFLPKSGEFDVARGCASLLVYFILCGIPVNIPQLILHQITNANLLTARGLPYGMLLSSLFDYWHVPRGGHETIDPPRPIDRSFMSRKTSHLPADRREGEEPSSPTTTSPPPQESHEFPTSHPATLSLVMHTLSEIACAVRYNYMLISDQHAKLQLDMPPPTTLAHPLPYADPPFPAWVDPYAAPASAAGASTSAPPPSAPPPEGGEGDVAGGGAPGGDGDAAQA